MITSYNLVVALAAGLLAPVARRLEPKRTAAAGLAVFTVASAGCAAAWSLPVLIGVRSLQGLGAALLLAAALPLLGGLAGSRERGAAAWTTVAILGAAIGPALGGVLTHLFDWRAIFVVQAPVAGVALLALRWAPTPGPEPRTRRLPGALAADVALGLVFAALVGALFLAVLLVITVWGLDPAVGALVVSALPAGTLAARAIGRGLTPFTAVAGGAALLAAGLVALTLLPRISNALVAVALGFCGIGIGLAVPVLTGVSLHTGASLVRSGSITIAARHAGLVLALALVAPLLTGSLERAGEQAVVGGTQAILDANLPLRKKVPIALGLRDAFEAAPDGEIPDLATPFDEAGAGSSASVRQARDSLLTTLRSAVTRGFRPAFALAALFAALSVIPAFRLRRTT